MKKLSRLKKTQDQNHLWSAVISAPFGKLGIKTEMFENSLMLREIFYVAQDTPLLTPQNQLARQATEQMHQYFVDPKIQFDLPLIPQGTTHQNHVWQEISKIPVGKALTYGELAKKIKSAPRAVGGACGANPYPLIVPCHRVISATGIGGFAHQDEEGYYRNIKMWLLKHEGMILP
jgi:methylated-DNA-[protein]-cysteine S-methyltransferase